MFISVFTCTLLKNLVVFNINALFNMNEQLINDIFTN